MIVLFENSCSAVSGMSLPFSMAKPSFPTAEFSTCRKIPNCASAKGFASRNLAFYKGSLLLSYSSARSFKNRGRIVVNAQNEDPDSEGEIPDRAMQATVQQSKKVLALQKELLKQIEERRKLVSSLKESKKGISFKKDASYEEDQASENIREESKVQDGDEKRAKGTSESLSMIASAEIDSENEALTEFLPNIKKGQSFKKDASYEEDKALENIKKESKVQDGGEKRAKGSSESLSTIVSAVINSENKALPEVLPNIQTSDALEFSGQASAPSSSSTSTMDLSTSSVVPHRFIPESKDLHRSETEQEPKLKTVVKDEITTVSGEGDAKPPPLAGTNVMNVIVVAAECAPWSKTGGLGDVAGALPKALARRGHRVMAVAPRYGDYREGTDAGIHKRYKIDGQDMEVRYYQTYIDGVDFVFISSPIFHGFNNNIYGGNRQDILKRMVLFCKAAVEGVD